MREGGSPRSTSRVPGWMYLIWLAAVPVQLVLGFVLSCDAWVALMSGQFRQVAPWPATHAIWVPITGFVVGFVGGGVAMRPWLVGAMAYALPTAFTTCIAALSSEWRMAAFGAGAIATSVIGAALGHHLVGRRFPVIWYGGSTCPQCAYPMTGIPPNAPCPERGAERSPRRGAGP